MTQKKGFPEGSACKPCWELKYCPYGDFMEFFPIFSNDHPAPDIEEIKNNHEKCISNIINGKLESEDDVWEEVYRLFFTKPFKWEYLSQFNPDDITCKLWGHVCPVFIAQDTYTETKEVRKQGRYIPRNVMFKVINRDNQICQLCKKNVLFDEVEFDHIIPVSKGGPSSVDNIRLLCRKCNREKSNSLNEILEE